MGLVSTLSLAAQSLKAQQVAIQTTGHNLANAAAPGYSRQRVDLVTAHPSFQDGVFIGQGVDVAGVSRVISRFAEAELLGLQGGVGYSEAQSRALTGIQQAFPLTGGVTGALSDFFSAWSDLANNPGGTTERVIVAAKVRALGESLAHTRQILSALQHNLDHDLKTAVTRVNLLTEQIAGLNKRISATEVGGEIANDFRDQRQLLLQELSQLTGATVREEPDGQVTVVFGGLLLVGGDRHASLDAGSVNAAGLVKLFYRSPDGTSFDATALFTGGTVGSLLYARDVETQDVIDRLDLFAQTLIEEINAQHALGFGLTGLTGGDLFQPLPSSAGAAAAVRVSAAVAADPRLIAAAAAPTALPGDNRNALAMLDLRSRAVPALQGLSLEGHFFSLVGDIGARAQAAESRYDFQRSLLTQAQARRESVSGVNIDEEMTRLIQFQRAFEASSLLVRTADSMYQNLIDMVR